MPEPISIAKLADITPTALIKSTSQTIKGLLVISAIAGIGWAIYAGVIRPVTKPNPSTIQTAEQITNIEIYNPEDKFFLGIRIFGLKFGITKPTIKSINEIIKEARND